jgi:hypothetical protein
MEWYLADSFMRRLIALERELETGMFKFFSGRKDEFIRDVRYGQGSYAGRGSYRCFGRRAENALFSRYVLCACMGYADSMHCMRCLQTGSQRPRGR